MLEIVYSPSQRQEQDTIHANCICGYDIQVLEMLCCNKSAPVSKMFYLPHPKTPKSYNDIILDALKSAPHPANTVEQIEQLSLAKNADVLITDTSNNALAFSLAYQKPSILFLPAFIQIDFNQEKYSEILKALTYIVFSFAKLENILQQITNNDKKEEIKKFLQGELL